MSTKLLRVDLPEEVWNRLDEEAQRDGVKIGVYVKRLIIARDKRQQERAR